ncbi:hypothetical protein DUNSADRAFT_11651 [Dunaliella salina]|uniref:Uncharacterized protein n=1 Tax=Dunaliella salina TaxID=3046 RepID=A0ABQ7GD06_DUNSA|nr:hypothetical protein DUNSADRAFT_11651 [Dunaliella salina]|eukprot:KAF5832451.1 hypothetical protein DUNSADRAFT_11651 [Dunaliella salina]
MQDEDKCLYCGACGTGPLAISYPWARVPASDRATIEEVVHDDMTFESGPSVETWCKCFACNKQPAARAAALQDY